MVIDDRKNLLHTVFNVEVPSGKAGYARLHQLPLALLREGLVKLDAMARQAPPDDVPTGDGLKPEAGRADRIPSHPDVTATAALVAALQVRAARLGITDTQFQTWLDSQQLPHHDGQLRLSVGERERLNASFNLALDAAKAEPPRQTARRGGKKAATGD